MLVTVASLIFLVLGACVVAFNWSGVIVGYRLKRKGLQRNISLIPLVTQVFVLVATVASFGAPSSPFPGWLFLLVAFADPALLSILYLPVFLLRKKFRVQI